MRRKMYETAKKFGTTKTSMAAASRSNGEDALRPARPKMNGESRVKELSAALALQNKYFGARPLNSGKRQQQPQQFYFGQNLNSLVKMSPFLEGDNKAKATSTTKSPKFGVKRPDLKIANGRFQRSANGDEPKPDSSNSSNCFADSLASYSSVFAKIKSGQSNSRFYDDDFLFRRPRSEELEATFLGRFSRTSETPNLSSTSASSKKFLPPRLTSCLSSTEIEKSQDEVIKEFEAELIQGKLRLRKMSDSGPHGLRRPRPLSSGTVEGSGDFIFETDLEVPLSPNSLTSESPPSPPPSSPPPPPPPPPPLPMSLLCK